MAEKQTNKERLKDITDSIETGIKELFESDRYRQYLATMSRFHRYSVNNTMLRLSALPHCWTKCVYPQKCSIDAVCPSLYKNVRSSA